jgi:hypothetical protein
MACVLPGGLWLEGTLRRDARLRPISGRLEHAIAVERERAESWPVLVSNALLHALEELAGEAPSLERIDALAIADRQYLLLQLNAALGEDRVWLSPECDSCGARFDLELRRSELPCRQSGTGFPFAEATLDDGRALCLRVPSGADQCRIATLSAESALTSLLDACVLSVDGCEPPADFAQTLDAAAIERIEAALDAVAPAFATQLSTRCPACAVMQQLEIDALLEVSVSTDTVLEEVHAIAFNYHWSEAEILALPRARRRRYLDLIDAARGMAS